MPALSVASKNGVRLFAHKAFGKGGSVSHRWERVEAVTARLLRSPHVAVDAEDHLLLYYGRECASAVAVSGMSETAVMERMKENRKKGCTEAYNNALERYHASISLEDLVSEYRMGKWYTLCPRIYVAMIKSAGPIVGCQSETMVAQLGLCSTCFDWTDDWQGLKNLLKIFKTEIAKLEARDQVGFVNLLLKKSTQGLIGDQCSRASVVILDWIPEILRPLVMVHQ